MPKTNFCRRQRPLLS